MVFCGRRDLSWGSDLSTADNQLWRRLDIEADTPAEVLPTSSDVEDAAALISNWIIATPVLESDALNRRAGCRVLVKAESLQHSGSFKIRGALNRLLRLSHDERQAGVVAYSSGNHAQGVAMAAKWLGIRATIVMPEDAPKIKQLNTRKLGAEIVLYDRYREDRERIAAEIAGRHGAALVPAFDHQEVIAGQGTVGLELVQFARRHRLTLDCLFVPCGGGGLVSGSGLSVKAAFPDCRIYAVEPEAYNDTAMSLAAGSRQIIAGNPKTICDALMAPIPGALTFAINRALLSAALAVTDAQASHAMAFAARHLKLVLEPSGAVGLAAVLAGAAADCDYAGVILSGANVDVDRYIGALNDFPDP
jgi:threonine dehydratase